MTERELQDAVIELAHIRKWRVAHFRPAMNERGQWRTAVAGDGAGFPDLVLVRDRVIFAELKSEIGKLSTYQQVWRDAIETAGGDYQLWRPADWTSGVIDGLLA